MRAFDGVEGLGNREVIVNQPSANLLDYSAVLDDLRERRARLDVAIAAVEAVVGMQHMAPRPSPNEAAATAGSACGVEPGSFVGMTVIDATIEYLNGISRSQRTTEILRALQCGGIALAGKSPINTVGAILNSHLKKSGVIVREGRGSWALASWSRPAKPQAEVGTIGLGSGRERVFAVVRSQVATPKFKASVAHGGDGAANATGFSNGHAEAP